MTTMLERLAAIIERQHHDAGSIYGYDGKANARELIEALRTPSAAMLKAADEATFSDPDFMHRVGPDSYQIAASPAKTWTAMLDSILTEQPAKDGDR